MNDSIIGTHESLELEAKLREISIQKEQGQVKLRFLLEKQELEKDRQRLLYTIILEQFLTTKAPSVYLSYFFDFRGRIYSYSAVDPLYNKMFRAFYFFKKTMNCLEIKNSKFYKAILAQNVDLKKYKIFIKNELDLYFFTVLLLELGKLKKQNGFNLQDFVDQGLYLYDHEDVVDLDDLSYYLQIKKEINFFLEKTY